jgi:hypothetical protein
MARPDSEPRYEYRVVPAPRKGEKAPGLRSPEGRFALALSRLFNHMGERGWEYVRADTLPAEERVGLTGKTVRYHTLLVFRRVVLPAFETPRLVSEPAPRAVAAPPRALEWQGFEEAETIASEPEVVALLSARARPRAAQ